MDLSKQSRDRLNAMRPKQPNEYEMLPDFLAANRTQLIERCKTTVAARCLLNATDVKLEHGIPLFIDQLVETLRAEEASGPRRSRKVSGQAAGESWALSEISITAGRHGREMLQHGFPIDHVVHSYGDLCQAVTKLAFERGKAIRVDEFRTLNRCLDNAIADAVTEYSYGHDVLMVEQGVQALNERLGFLAHELRNHINTASLALLALKSGEIALLGATGTVLERSLVGVRNLIDRTLAGVRVTAGMPAQRSLIPLTNLINEVNASASLEAQIRECAFTVAAVDPMLAVDVDRDLLLAAIGNLLQNAFKFTQPHSAVSMTAYAAADRILIEVEDSCGGLPPGAAEEMFLPFAQKSPDKSGLGLGLAITRRSVEENHGVLRVRDRPGFGCVFTIDLPRRSVTPPLPQRNDADPDLGSASAA